MERRLRGGDAAGVEPEFQCAPNESRFQSARRQRGRLDLRNERLEEIN